jgi:hypothetical protein
MLKISDKPYKITKIVLTGTLNDGSGRRLQFKLGQP